MLRFFALASLVAAPLSFAAPNTLQQTETPGPDSQNIAEASFCRNGLFPREQEDLRLAVIHAEKDEKVHFYDDADGCPKAHDRCKRPSYLVPGNKILAGKQNAEWVCVWYEGKQHETVSWLPSKAVRLMPDAALPTPKDWVGTWVDDANAIHIQQDRASGSLTVRSKIRWDGGVVPSGEHNVHYGGIKAALAVSGRHAVAEQSSCMLKATLIGRYLVVDDNGTCGGTNVRHTGVYLRPVHVSHKADH